MNKTLAFITLAASVFSAQAHHVWIEQNSNGATLYFGEFGGNLREASPGLLDKFAGPVAMHVSAKGESKLAVSKTPGGFAIGARAGKGESIVAEEATYPVSENTQAGKVVRGIYVPAARLVSDFTPQAPRLTLDLVPTGKADGEQIEFQAFFKGKPLPKAKVELISVSGWGQEHHADDAGKFTVKLPWQGTYVLEMSHRDGAGERANGDKYDRASYVTSLTVLQPSGLPSLPTPPAAAPSKAD